MEMVHAASGDGEVIALGNLVLSRKLGPARNQLLVGRRVLGEERLRAARAGCSGS